MVTTVRWSVVVLLGFHGLLHLLGVAKGFGWARIPALTEPISVTLGTLWLLAAMLILTAATMLAASTPRWQWMVALLAALVSQIAIVTSWSDAKAGTLVNVTLLLVAAYGFMSMGPFSFAAQWNTQTEAALEQVDATPSVLTRAQLADLPAPLVAYVQRTGATGRPRTTSFHAHINGRIRSAPDGAWMPFTGQQLNTYGDNPRRMFLMHATRSGIPVEVFHLFRDATATMRVKVLSAFPIVDAAGPEMDCAETVTIFNDLVVFAPGAIPDAPVLWTEVDSSHVHGVFTLGRQSVSATLTFDDQHDLIDFTSPDRLRASQDGKTFTREEWSTPILAHRNTNEGRIMTAGEAQWMGPDGPFTYLEIGLDDISFN